VDSLSPELLRELRVALLEAMAESREMRRVLKRLRSQGWSAYIVIDETAAEPTGSDGGPRPLLEAPPDNPPESGIDGADARFLRSLGIDPTPDLRRA